MSFTIHGTNGLTFPDGSAQAESMTDYGIGSVGVTITDLNAVTVNGFYRYAAGATGAPSANAGVCWYMNYDTGGFRHVVAIGAINRKMYFKGGVGSALSVVSWYEIFNASTDGNGGQPPAPKPRSATGAGNFVNLERATNTAVVLPAGGTWCGFTVGFASATGVTNGGGTAFAETAGGSTIHAAVSGAYYKGFAWRITE